MSVRDQLVSIVCYHMWGFLLKIVKVSSGLDFCVSIFGTPWSENALGEPALAA